MREVVCDVSLLEHPEPLEIVSAAARGLKAGEYIKMLHRKEPLMLFPILDSLGLVYRCDRLGEGRFCIFIAHREDAGKLPEP